MPLQSAVDAYVAQRRLTVVAIAASRRAWSIRNVSALARTLATLMQQAAANTASSTSDMLAEQGIHAVPEARVVASTFAETASDGRSLTALLEQAETSLDLDRMAWTQVADAARAAQSVEIAVRPQVTGYVRYLNPPSCGRCAVLAGRFYRWSAGFLRHPQCDCIMVPSTQKAADELIGNPDEAFRAGQVRGLSKADEQAVREGADLGQVVNVRRRAAGLTIAGRVQERGGRPTPEGIYRLASDRTEAIRLLRKFGYII